MFVYFLIVVLAVLFDFGSKALILDTLSRGEAIEVTPFFNIVFAMNTGISFSMFSNAGPWILTAVAFVICAFIIYFIITEKDVFTRACLSLVLGGAIGNIIDRIRFEAVVDFLDFHAFGYHWPAFNVADSCICIGVVLLLFRMVLNKEKKK
ncbi:MAG: signal peptidase II [Alphaproteobacteria bacterium]|nr:signal peptidase II [Alphaproteobacteria bacterium]